jgi:hypothetical protein
MSVSSYTTDLTKSECVRRLQGHAGRRCWGQRWVEGTILAKIRGDHFRLFAWGPTNVRNSFAPFFYGHLEEEGGRTRIQGCFRIHPFARAFLIVWFGGLMAEGSLILLLPTSAWGFGGRPPPVFAVLGIAGMMLLGYGFVRFARWLGRGQVESVRSFLTRELKALPYVARSSVKQVERTAAAPTDL